MQSVWVHGCVNVREYVCMCTSVHRKMGEGLFTTVGPRSASTIPNPLPHTAQRAADGQNWGEEGRRVTSEQGPRGGQSKTEKIERQRVESSRKGNRTCRCSVISFQCMRMQKISRIVFDRSVEMFGRKF